LGGVKIDPWSGGGLALPMPNMHHMSRLGGITLELVSAGGFRSGCDMGGPILNSTQSRRCSVQRQPWFCELTANLITNRLDVFFSCCVLMIVVYWCKRVCFAVVWTCGLGNSSCHLIFDFVGDSMFRNAFWNYGGFVCTVNSNGISIYQQVQRACSVSIQVPLSFPCFPSVRIRLRHSKTDRWAPVSSQARHTSPMLFNPFASHSGFKKLCHDIILSTRKRVLDSYRCEVTSSDLISMLSRCEDHGQIRSTCRLFVS